MTLGTMRQKEADFVISFGVTKDGTVGWVVVQEGRPPRGIWPGKRRVRWSVPSSWLAFHEEEDEDIDPELAPLRVGERVKLEGTDEPTLYEMTGEVLEVEREKPWLWEARVRVKKLMSFVGTP